MASHPPHSDAPGDVHTEQADRARRLTLTAVAGAAEDVVEFARRYWAATGVDQYGKVAWAEPAGQIDPAMGPAYLVAGAGAEVTVADVACRRCGVTPWRAKSRSDVDGYVSTGSAGGSGCGRCDANFLKGVAREQKPATLTRRAADRQGAARRAEEMQRQQTQAARTRAGKQAWNDARRRCVADTWPLTFTGAPDLLAVLEQIDAPLRAEAATLAALRYAPSVTPIPPLRGWASSLTPDGALDFDLAEQWFQHRLLAVHPDSDLDAFPWSPSTEDALAAAGDPQSLPEPSHGNSIYPLRVAWYVPHATSMGTGAERLGAALVERLTPDRLSAHRREALLGLVSALITEETITYFEFHLDLLNLPPVAEHHRPRMTEAAARLGAVRSLGEAYNIAWRAAHSAAAAAQRQPRAPKANMTTHGLKVFESAVQQALDPGHALPCYNADSRVPVSSLTRTVFHTILAADPFTTSRTDVAARLPVPPPAVGASTRTTAGGGDCSPFDAGWLRMLASPPQPYDPLVARDALVEVAEGDLDDLDPDLWRAAEALVGVYDAVAACTSEPYAPAVAMAAAVHTVLGDVPGAEGQAPRIHGRRADVLAGVIDLAVWPEKPSSPTT